MQVSREERESHNLASPTLERAVEAVRVHAFVVLENLLIPDVVADARGACEKVLERKNRNNTALPYELKSRPPFAELAGNPIIARVVMAILGEEPSPRRMWWIRRCPPEGSAIAHVHRDVSGPADVETGELPLQISVDIMLTEFTEENGATRIWPGTQNTFEASVDEHVSVGEMAAKIPCARITGPAGSVCFRDARAWHCSGVNHTEDDRMMLSI